MAAKWTVVAPYYNEREYLPAMLRGLLAQEYRPFDLILVDNASDDGSTDICRDLLKDAPGITPIYLHEPRPGKTNALECGMARVETEFVAVFDADTFYPPHYLKRADEIFAQSPADVVAVMAPDLRAPPSDPAARRRQRKTLFVAALLSKQAHTGGFGHTFRMAALRQAGGFSTALWPFVVEDHEVMQRVFKVGRSRYDFDFWCIPSQRRSDRTSVNWTLFERLLYHAVPFAFKDWFFYGFLAKRFAARRFSQLKYREKTWL